MSRINFREVDSEIFPPVEMSSFQGVELPVGGSILRQKTIRTPWGPYQLLFYSEPTYQPNRPFIYRLVVLEPGLNSILSGENVYNLAPTEADWPELTWMETTAFDTVAQNLPAYGSNWSVYTNLL